MSQYSFSDKTATELFAEAKHYIEIENLSAGEIRKYLWVGEHADGEDVDSY